MLEAPIPLFSVRLAPTLLKQMAHALLVTKPLANFVLL